MCGSAFLVVCNNNSDARQNLALGWVGVFAAASFLQVLPGSTLTLIVLGGLLYSAGVLFYLWEKLK